MKTYNNLSEKDKNEIKLSLSQFIDNMSKNISAWPAAVANASFYFLQRQSDWGRNATEQQKKASYEHWKGVCSRCQMHVDISEVVFHHKERGIPNQHNPLNLLPQHESCHDQEHHVTKNSLSKGSPRKQNVKS